MEKSIVYHDSLTQNNLKSIVDNINSHALLKIFLSAFLISSNWVFNGSFDGLLVIACLILLDTVTGLIKAVKARIVSSKGFFRVMAKCMVYFIMIATTELVDKTLPSRIATPITLTFLGVTEGISVIENLVVLDFPVINNILRRLRSLAERAKLVSPTENNKKKGE